MVFLRDWRGHANIGYSMSLNKKLLFFSGLLIVTLIFAGAHFYAQRLQRTPLPPRPEVSLTIIPGWNVRQIAKYFVAQHIVRSTKDFFAITGPSGSGKSTLMNVIGLLDTATSGSYILNGENVTKLSDDALARVRNKEIGFVFQLISSFQIYLALNLIFLF